MAKCDACGKMSLVPEKFGDVLICKGCFMKLNGLLWRYRQYDRRDDVEKQRGKVIALAKNQNFPENVIKELLDFNYEIISLSTFINEKEEGIEKIIPSSLVNIEQEAIDNAFKQELLNKINTLNDSEKKVLIKKYGFDERGEKTYSEVGRELNLSRQRVHQIEQKALSKLSTDASLKK